MEKSTSWKNCKETITCWKYFQNVNIHSFIYFWSAVRTQSLQPSNCLQQLAIDIDDFDNCLNIMQPKVSLRWFLSCKSISFLRSLTWSVLLHVITTAFSNFDLSTFICCSKSPIIHIQNVHLVNALLDINLLRIRNCILYFLSKSKPFI